MHHGKISKDVAKGLKELRKRIGKAGVPATALDQTFNLATWNIREFGKKRRKKISLHLIAEVMGLFDLVAVTEVRDKLDDLNEVMDILGPYWKAVFSDFNTDRRGNRERIAFVYDKRSVVFTGLAAEPDPPRKKEPKTGESIPKITWWRSPYMASFRAGNFDFILLAAHIRWDKTGGEESRAKELKLLADWVAARHKEKGLVDKDIIVLGDFNISSPKLLKAITSKGLMIPTALKKEVQGGIGTNLAKTEHEDQILHLPKETIGCFKNEGGVVDFYTGGFTGLFPGLKLSGKADYTYQLSDHLPLWIQVWTDTADEKLDQIINS